MTRKAYKFTFSPEIHMGEVLRGLILSTIAVAAIHGESAMMTDGKFDVCKRGRYCIIDAETELGADLVKVFARFMNLYSGGCFRTEFVESRSVLGDMLDLCGACIR